MGYSGNGLLVTSTPDGKYVYAGGSQDTCGGLTVLGNDTLKRFGPICPFVTRWEACSHTAGILNLSYQLGQSRVYPNPNTGTFVIEFKSEVPVSRLEIYNVFGGIIYNTKTVPSNSLLRIDLGSCSSGLYFYRLFNDVGQIAGCGKIIIQH